jgi:hypothetical protein
MTPEPRSGGMFSDTFFNPPRVQPYDPPPPSTGYLTIVVENQRQDRDNWTLGMVETEPTGRVRIVIEGEREEVAPYLAAISEIARERA